MPSGTQASIEVVETLVPIVVVLTAVVVEVQTSQPGTKEVFPQPSPTGPEVKLHTPGAQDGTTGVQQSKYLQKSAGLGSSALVVAIGAPTAAAPVEITEGLNPEMLCAKVKAGVLGSQVTLKTPAFH